MGVKALHVDDTVREKDGETLKTRDKIKWSEERGGLLKILQHHLDADREYTVYEDGEIR